MSRRRRRRSNETWRPFKPEFRSLALRFKRLSSLPIFGGGGWPNSNFRIRDTAWISRSLLFFPPTKKFSCARKYEPAPPKVNGLDLKWGGMPRDTLNGTSRTGRRYSRSQKSSSSKCLNSNYYFPLFLILSIHHIFRVSGVSV